MKFARCVAYGSHTWAPTTKDVIPVCVVCGAEADAPTLLEILGGRAESDPPPHRGEDD